jgi:hypothetical protein
MLNASHDRYKYSYHNFKHTKQVRLIDLVEAHKLDHLINANMFWINAGDEDDDEDDDEEEEEEDEGEDDDSDDETDEKVKKSSENGTKSDTSLKVETEKISAQDQAQKQQWAIDCMNEALSSVQKLDVATRGTGKQCMQLVIIFNNTFCRC